MKVPVVFSYLSIELICSCSGISHVKVSLEIISALENQSY